jgi:3-methyladenine DNA glycosylase AlkD
MRSTRFAAAVRERLLARADPVVKANYEWYFKGAVRFLGLKTPGIREVAREVEPLLEGRPISALVDESFRLLRSPWAEEKHVAIALLGRNVQRLPARFLRDFEPVFDRSVHDWGACDHVAGRILRPLVALPATRKRIVGWRGARSPWRQRAAAVAFVNEARHGRYNSEILTICRSLVRNPDRFVQLGMGWVLRELFLADRTVVLGFLARHYPLINREALRYAVEKMPATLQIRLLEQHRAAARNPRDSSSASRAVPGRRVTRS